MNVPKIIERAGERVLTTVQLAEAYETDECTIQQNYHRNKSRYIEGKHFYLLKGEPLRKLKNDLTNCQIAIPKNVNRYYLWTERGALLHAKSLNTDKAWEVYDFLVENYFRKKDILPKLPAAPPKPLTPEQCEQKRIAVLLAEFRFKQARLATAEAKLAAQKADVAFERNAVADYVMLHPELMAYVKSIESF